MVSRGRSVGVLRLLAPGDINRGHDGTPAQ